MKILFLTSRLPFPVLGGDKLRTYNFLKHLSKRHKITLLSFVENDAELDGIPPNQRYFHKLVTVKLPKRKSYLNCARGIFSKRPLQVHYYWSKEMKQAVERELRNDYDLVFSHLIRMAQYLPQDGRQKKIIDFTDAISLNYTRSRHFRKGLSSLINMIEDRRVFNYEHAALQKANLSLFISDVDAAYLTNRLNREKIRVVQNGVDLETNGKNTTKEAEERIVFLGNMRTFPNTDAVLYFAREVFPLLKREKPALKFYVVGCEPPTAVRALHDGENIIVTGFVESVHELLKSARVLVAPMRAGAGVQNKILEAMAAGVPVVTTEVGAEGLERSQLLIAHSAHEFSAKVVHLLNNDDIRRALAKNARKYVEQNFAWTAVLSELNTEIEKLCDSGEGKSENTLESTKSIIEPVAPLS